MLTHTTALYNIEHRRSILFVIFSLPRFPSLSFTPPRCAFCKSFEIIFHELSRIFASDSIQMVRLDATKNEVNHPKVHINSFPAFYFFTVGDQENPMEYDGERSVVAIQKFIETFRSKVKTPLPSLKEEEVEVEDDNKMMTTEGEINEMIENETQIGEQDDQIPRES